MILGDLEPGSTIPVCKTREPSIEVASTSSTVFSRPSIFGWLLLIYSSNSGLLFGHAAVTVFLASYSQLRFRPHRLHRIDPAWPIGAE